MSSLEQAPARTRRRSVEWEDPMASAAAGMNLAGIDFLSAVRDNSLPPAPIAALLGFTIVAVEPGRTVFALEPAEWMYNPIGSVHGGVAATLLDSCMGCAVHTLLERGVGYATTDLSVRYIRAMSEDTGRVLAEGRVLHAGRRTATAEGRLFAETNEALLAHATTGCAILR